MLLGVVRLRLKNGHCAFNLHASEQPFGEKGRGSFNLIKYKINIFFFKKRKQTTNVPLERPVFCSAPLFSQLVGSKSVGSCSSD